MRLNQTLAFLAFGVIFGFFAQTVSAYYSPEVGRFISRDPIEYEAEDTNLYRYVGNNTINAKDYSGLDVWIETPGAVAGFHKRICVTVPNDCEDATCDERGKPYCITFYNDGRGGGCSNNSSCGRSCGSLSDSGESSSQDSSSSSGSCCGKTGGISGNPSPLECDFGSSLPTNFPKSPRGAGTIGPDNKHPSKGTDSAIEDFLLKLSNKQDCEVYKYFKNLENTRGNYRFYWYNCRHFSHDLYDIIDQQYCDTQ
jgi:hypothetical protein